MNFLGTGVDCFVHFFQCVSFCGCEILDSFSIFRNKVVLACFVDCSFVLSLLMRYRHEFPSLNFYNFFFWINFYNFNSNLTA